MAKQDLTLNINSKFNGEGIKKLDSALKSTSKTVASASRAVGSISSELSKVSGVAGKAAGAVSGLFSAIAAGGPLGLVIAGVTAAVSFLAKSFQDAKERAKELAKAVSENLVSSFHKVVEEASKANAQISESLQRAKNLADATKRLSGIDIRRENASVQGRGLSERAGMEIGSYEYKKSKIRESRDLAISNAEKNVAISKIDLEPAKKTLNAAEESKRVQEQALQTLRMKQENDIRNNQSIEDELNRLDEAVRKAQEDFDRNPVQTSNAMQRNAFLATANSDIQPYSQKQLLEIAEKSFPKTAYERLQEAIDRRTQFMKREDVKNYDERQKKYAEDLAKQEEELKKANEQLQKATTDYFIQLRENSTVQKEHEIALKQIEEAYNEQMKQLDDSAKAEEDRRKKEEESERKRIEAEQERKRREEDAKNRATEQKRLEKQREKVLKDANEEAKLLADAEKKARSAFDDAAKKAKEVADQWTANSAMRPSEWRKMERDSDRQKEKAQKDAEANRRNVLNETGRIAGRIFGRDGSLRRGANAFDIGRFAENADYLGFTNVDQKQIDSLQQQREKLRKRLFNDDGSLKRGVNERGQEMGQFKALDKALGKWDKVQDAKKKKEEAEKLEKERAANEQKRTVALESIKRQMEKLAEKTEL